MSILRWKFQRYISKISEFIALFSHDYFFEDDWTLGEHIKIHTGQAKYFCSYCGKGCSTPFTLGKHMAEHSVDESIIETDKSCNKYFNCDVSWMNWKTSGLSGVLF